MTVSCHKPNRLRMKVTRRLLSVPSLLLFLLLLFLILIVIVADVVVADDIHNNSDDDDDDNRVGEGGWSWERIFSYATEDDPIIANGNVFPARKDESSDDCLILVSRNQLMHYCPADESQRTVLHRGNPGKYRGAFVGLSGGGRRLWMLDSPDFSHLTPLESKQLMKADVKHNHDRLLELDTVTGKVVQSLIVDDCIDGHDAVLAPSSRNPEKNKSVYLVDTRHGDVVEIAVPASAEPYTQSSLDSGAELPTKKGYVNIRKRHTGFTRADHINNVAVHSHLLISNLHGKDAMSHRAKQSSSLPSPTRLTALHKSNPQERELNLQEDGFESVQNVGTWCHGIAFWQSPNTDEVQLISLDSKSGTIVSVVLTGSRKNTRTVLWEPDPTHPILVPPEGVAAKYRNGAGVFSKGLAVQGNVAYFGVSYARAPPLRRTVPETLLVAVDLLTGQEIFVRTIRSNGLINQILTRSYLQQDIMLSPQRSTVELTHHNFLATTTDKEINQKSTARNPIIAGSLDKEVVDHIDDVVHVTATFAPQKQCLDENGRTKHLSLKNKALAILPSISSIDNQLDSFVQHLCNLNVQPVKDALLPMIKQGAFTKHYQIQHNNTIINAGIDKIKPGIESIILIFSSRSGHEVYHFPWIQPQYEISLFPILKSHILDPLNIPIQNILRMHLANMPVGSNINFHKDLNGWVQRSHRVHVPIITHDHIFFLAETHHQKNKPLNRVLRIKSKEGEVYEFNNGKGHAVRNTGKSTRVHLIIDWVESPFDNPILFQPKLSCDRIRGQDSLSCHDFMETTDSNDEL